MRAKYDVHFESIFYCKRHAYLIQVVCVFRGEAGVK